MQRFQNDGKPLPEKSLILLQGAPESVRFDTGAPRRTGSWAIRIQPLFSLYSRVAAFGSHDNPQIMKIFSARRVSSPGHLVSTSQAGTALCGRTQESASPWNTACETSSQLVHSKDGVVLMIRLRQIHSFHAAAARGLCRVVWAAQDP